MLEGPVDDAGNVVGAGVKYTYPQGNGFLLGTWDITGASMRAGHEEAAW